MKQLLFALVLVSFHLTSLAQSPEIGDSTTTFLNASAANRQRVFFGGPNKDEIFGRTNTGIIKRFAPVRSVNGKIGAITLLKSDFSFLSNVDNTADLSKPISSATLTALNRKAENMTLSMLRANSSLAPPETVLMLENGLYGFYRLNASDNSTADNSLTVLVTAAGKRYERIGLVFPANSVPLTSLAGGGATTGQVPIWNGTAFAPGTITSGGGGTGTVNSASNVNTTGVGIYQSLVGSDLQFKGIQAGSSKIAVTDNTVNKTVSVDVNEANLTLAQSQVTGLTTALAGKEAILPTGTTGQVLLGNKTLGTLAPALVGLGNVDNTSDAAKPISTATATALSGKEPTLPTGTASQVILGNKTLGTLNSSLVGLGNVDNTSDANKPVSTATQTALNLKAPLASPAFTGTPTAPTALSTDNSTQIATTAWVKNQGYGVSTGGEANTGSNQNTAGVGVFNGKSGLDLQFKGIAPASSKVTVTNNVTNKTIDLDVVESALTLTQSQVTGLTGALSGKEPTIATGTTGQYITGAKTLATLDKTAVGLGSVDNTSDAAKPISTATATALSGKEPTIPTGTASQVVLGNKTLGTLNSSLVGLGNVDNTSDLNKPISTAVATALSGKQATITAGSLPLTHLAQTGATNGQVLAWNGTAYAPITAGAAGEANTGANLGTGGVGVYDSKTGAAIGFRSVNAGSSKVAVTLDSPNKEVDIDIVETNLTLTQSQVTGLTTALSGKESTLPTGTTGQVLLGNKTLGTLAPALVGLGNVPNVDATNASNLATGSIPPARISGLSLPLGSLSQSGATTGQVSTWNGTSWAPATPTTGGETNTASNIGTAGVGVYKQKTGVNLELKKVNAGSNKISITDDTANNEIDIDVNQANLSIATSQLTGTSLAAQEPAHTGDVTNTAGSLANTIATGVVTNAKLATMATSTFKGRVTAGTGPVEDLSVTQLKTAISLNNVDNTSDASKPVSTATATALSGKEPTIPTGTASQVVLGNKTLGTLNSSLVGLGNVDNTSDLNKPISTAVATALSGKQATLTAGSLPLTHLAQTGATNGQVLAWNGTAYAPTTAGAAGETNTASNAGTAGVGVFDNKTGVNFGLRNINAGSSKVTVTLDSPNKEVDIDVNQANLAISTTQLTGVIQNSQLVQMPAKTLKGNNVGSTGNAADLTVNQVKTMLDLNRLGKAVDVRNFGVVYGKSVSTGTRTANTNALQIALNDSIPDIFSDVIEINGTITITNKPVNIEGTGRESGIYQYANVNALNITTTLPNADGKCPIIIKDVWFVAGGALTASTAININSQSNYPTVSITDVSVVRTGDGNYFGTGIAVVNPTELIIDGFRYYGQPNVLGTRGIAWTNTKAAVSSTVRNSKVYDAEYGMRITSSSIPGIEGVRVQSSDFVGVKYGIWAVSTADSTLYMPPQIHIDGCHVNAYAQCIYVKNYSQIKVNNGLFYLYNSTPNVGKHIDIDLSGEMAIQSNHFFTNGSGETIPITVRTSHYHTLISDNFAIMRSGSTATMINLSGTARASIHGNRAWQGAGVLTGSTGNGTNYDNLWYPDGLAGALTSTDIVYTNETTPLPTSTDVLNRIEGDVLTVKADGKFDPRNLYQTVNLAGNGTATYYLITQSSGAFNNAGNIDAVRLLAQVGEWSSANKMQDIDFSCTTRDNFRYNWTSRGVQQASNGSGIVGYRNGDGTTSFYLVLSGTFQRGTVTMLYRNGFSLMTRRLIDVATTTTPSGTLLFDSRLPNTYLPSTDNFVQGDNESRSQIITNVNVPLKSGFYSITNSVNMPTTGSWHLIIHRFSSGGAEYRWDMAREVGSTQWVHRLVDNNVYPTWTTVDSGNSNTIGGVTVTGTPTSGQVITATSSSAATWQTPSGSSPGANVQSGTTYTFVASDCGKTVEFTNASAITATIPSSILTLNCYVYWMQAGTGQITFVDGPSMVSTSFNGQKKSAGQYAQGSLYSRSATVVNINGATTN